MNTWVCREYVDEKLGRGIISCVCDTCDTWNKEIFRFVTM